LNIIKYKKREKQMKNGALIIFSAILVMFLLLNSADALPVDGALSGWEPDTISFDYTYDGRTLSGQIEYAVYDNYPGNWPSGDYYIYAYHITNSQLSDVAIDSFSLSIFGDVDVGGIGYDGYGVDEDGKEAFAYFSPDSSTPQSAIYLFMPEPYAEGAIEPGDESLNLLFTSPYAPTTGYGVIEGGSMGAMISELATPMPEPAPLPEPATILLLGIGGGLVTMMRNRNR
jgi:hypothetical protein